jgi:hypothetical protein
MDMDMVVPAIHLTFYKSRSGGYTVTKDLRGDPRIEKIIYRI